MFDWLQGIISGSIIISYLTENGRFGTHDLEELGMVVVQDKVRNMDMD
jgi:hypothetical protein